MSACHAVLLDTVSIQSYIFQSNKLKENLGASYLVQEIYRSYLACALCTITGRTFDEELQHLEDWKSSDADKPDCTKPVDIGYIGGGNALLFFPNENQAQKFIEEWTKILLVHAPGLSTAVASDSFPQDPQQFQSSLQALFVQLEVNKARHSPITSLPRHGITAECARSGASAEVYNDNIEVFVSAGVNARIEAAIASKYELEVKKYKKVLGERYCFSNELDDLGGMSGEDSHIAIVHIDGNDIGERFKQAQNLKAIRALSKIVEEATQAAFEAVIAKAVKEHERIMKSLGFDPNSNDPDRYYPADEYRITDKTIALLAKANVPQSLLAQLHTLKNRNPKSKKNFLNALANAIGSDATERYKPQFLKHAEQQYILPIRPVILGGDDVTFVCDGKLGIYFAEIFIKKFEEAKIADKNLTACAGVAIIKTKYPFYRGYWLAERLCANAKSKRKEEGSAASFFDFHVALGGVAGSLKMIRTWDFEQRLRGSLLYRPFKIVPKEPFDDHSLDMFLEKVQHLAESLPQNKRHELRDVLARSEEAAREFVQALKYRGRTLPEIRGHQYAETLFENNKTPYFDMLEILRFYPDFVLKEIGEKA